MKYTYASKGVKSSLSEAGRKIMNKKKLHLNENKFIIFWKCAYFPVYFFTLQLKILSVETQVHISSTNSNEVEWGEQEKQNKKTKQNKTERR